MKHISNVQYNKKKKPKLYDRIRTY